MNQPAGENGSNARYQHVRRALQERGYLEPPLERLFLGGTSGARRGAWILNAVLAGLFAGPPLGLLLAGVVVAQSAGLIPIWPDGAIYAVFFTPVLGVAVGAIEAIVALCIRWASRSGTLSPRRAAWVAGVAVGVVFSLYLGFWAMRQTGAFGLRDFVCLVALAIGAGFAGRVVSAAALVEAVYASGRVPTEARPRLWRGLLSAATVFVLLAALLAGSLRLGSGQAVLDAHSPNARGTLAAFVAWDGLSRELARGIERESTASNPTADLIGSERNAVTVQHSDGSDAVAFWTTVATGCPADRHGVRATLLPTLKGGQAPLISHGIAAGPLELLARLLPTEPRIARAGVRSIPAIWEIAADARKTAVIGWWATWPATSPGAAGGYVVSDGALAATIAGRFVDQAVFPSTWGARESPDWLARARVAAGEAPPVSERGDRLAWEALVGDLYLIESFAAVSRDPDLGAVFLYLPGLDVVRERSRRGGEDPFTILERLRRHALTVDSALERIRHGAADGRSRPVSISLFGWPGRAAEGESGWWASIPPASRDTAANPEVTSIAPTWLALQGLSIDDRMCGEPWGIVAGKRKTRVTPAKPAPASEAFEQDVLERLRSLGYVDQ